MTSDDAAVGLVVEMAVVLRESTLLAFFGCLCRGVKFYHLAEVGAEVFSRVRFERDPSNSRDPNCVEVFVSSTTGQWRKLGHVAREAAEWLSPLLTGPFNIFG